MSRSRLVAPLLTRLARWPTTSTLSRSVACGPSVVSALCACALMAASRPTVSTEREGKPTAR
ncbi:hypothetical protein D9M68_918050 [compost metagenome]